MAENRASGKSYLEYKSVDVYFTYSFVVDFGDSSYEEFINKNASVWKAGHDVLPDRHGVTPFLTVTKRSRDANRGYVPLAVSRKITLTELFKNSNRPTLKYFRAAQYKKRPIAAFDVSCATVARLFYNGSGCVTFRIRYGLPVGSSGGWRVIKQILALSRSTYTPVGVATLGSQLLYQNFRKVLTLLVKGNGIRLLCDDISNAADVEKKRNTPTFGVCPQNPNTFILVELRDDANGGVPFWAEELGDTLVPKCRKKYQELASILLNIIPNDNPECSPRSQIDHVLVPARIRNLAWDSRLHLSCDHLTVLLAKHENAKPQHGFIEYSLLDALEILRTRWHMSIVMNALLDQDIDREKSDDSKRNLNALRDLIRRRQQFGKLLHDPLAYRFVGGAVTDVVEQLEAGLSLDKLQRSTRQKFETLDKVLQDRLTYVQLQEFEMYCAKRKG